MQERQRFEHEVTALAAPAPPALKLHKWPEVMFEFDVHCGYLDEVDRQLHQTPTWGMLTTHSKAADLFDVKRDLNRMEIGTRHFKLSAKGLSGLATAKQNIARFVQELRAACGAVRPAQGIRVPHVVGHPRPFALPHASAAASASMVYRLPEKVYDKAERKSHMEFVDSCQVWASPQAHLTLPLSRVGELVEAIQESIGKSAGVALTGSKPARMGFRSDHLFRARRGVAAARREIVRRKPVLSDGTVVDQTTFSDSLAGFLILVVSYLWVARLASKLDYEFYGKGHLPINVKTPFHEIFSQLLNPTERRIYVELFAGPAVRQTLFALVKPHPTPATGSTRLFPPVVSDAITWNELLDWTMAPGARSPDWLPGGGTVWPVAKTYPRVALELRRIGFRQLDARAWGKLMDTIVAHAQRLNR